MYVTIRIFQGVLQDSSRPGFIATGRLLVFVGPVKSAPQISAPASKDNKLRGVLVDPAHKEPGNGADPGLPQVRHGFNIDTRYIPGH